MLERLISPENGGVVPRCSDRPRSSTTARWGQRLRSSARRLPSAPSARWLLILTASVRRRRRDLALLKTLGFTRRQLAAVVGWQSTVAVAIGVIIGTPLGIVVGRFLWDGFAGEIHVVPASTAPVSTILLIALGALLVANIAAHPRPAEPLTPTAVLLRAE